VVGIRLSGGLGPLRVSVPLTSGRRRRRSGSSGAGLKALGGGLMALGYLLWWTLLYGVYWPMRLVYFELPRAGWRAYQRWQQSRRAVAGPTG
jgi:hypothetical protein